MKRIPQVAHGIIVNLLKLIDDRRDIARFVHPFQVAAGSGLHKACDAKPAEFCSVSIL
jgi:hypothetical protein